MKRSAIDRFSEDLTGFYIEMEERRLGLWDFAAYPLFETGPALIEDLAVRSEHVTALLWPAIPAGRWYDVWHLDDTAFCMGHPKAAGWCPLEREWSRSDERLPTDWNMALDSLLSAARACYSV